MKKNIYKPKKIDVKKIFLNKMGIKLAALALALGIGSYTFINDNEFNVEPPPMTEPKLPKDLITLALTTNLKEKEEEEEIDIPIFKDSEGKNIITTVAPKTLIISKERIIENQDNKLHLISAITSDEQLITGYINHNNLSNITYINEKNSCSLYKVTSNNGIYLRNTPEIKDNILIGIPTGSILLGAKPDKNANNLWTKVIYFNGSSINEGYASGKYLEKVAHIVDKYKKDDLELDYYINNDNVMGIDVAHIKPDILNNLLNGTIKLSDFVENRYGKKINISNFENKQINFVYIKMFGSAYGSDKLKKGKDTPYLALAQICEKNNIPYGFYYYSTCTTPDEAKQEYLWISEAIEKLEKRDYHLLPFAIDVEVHSEKDRQNKVSIEDLTNSKSILANLLENDLGKTILYTSRNACDNDLASKILDIDQYQKNLHSGESHIWFVSPGHSRLHKKSLEKISHYVTARQIALDIKTDTSQYNLIDINTIELAAFEDYISGKYQNSNRYIARDITLYSELER